MKRLFLALMLLAGISYANDFNLTDFNYYTCAEKVDIYSSPDPNSKIFTNIPYGTEIKPLGDYISSKDGWTFAKVRIGEHDGYVNDHMFFHLKKGQTFEPLITKLPLKNGKSLEFTNNYCEGEQYSVTSLISHENNLGFYVVNRKMREGSESFLIDENDGTKHKIYGGRLVFSPDKKKFLVSSYDVYADAYSIVIYSIANRKPVLTFKKISSFMSTGIKWDPNEVNWLSNATVGYTLNSKTGQMPQQIIFNGKKWVETTNQYKNPNATGNQFLLARGKAGLTEVGMPIRQVEKTYTKEFTKIINGETDDGPYSDLIIYDDKSKGNKVLLRCELDDRNERHINSITVYDPRYKTEKGIGVGSDYATLRKEYKVDGIAQCWGRPGEAGGPCAIVEDLKMSFVFRQNASEKLSGTNDVNIFPGSMVIARVIITGPQ